MPTKDSKIVRLISRYEKLFAWVRIFYPKAKGVPIQYLLYCFVPQKLFMINGRVPWPVHFTSRVLYPKRMTVGTCCAPGLAGNCYIQARNGIYVGDNLWTGPGVGLISSNHDLNDYRRHVDTEPLRIGNNVWIGMNAVLLPSITVGNNVAIGANAVVTKDLPDNVIAVGNPCRVIKKKPLYQGISTSG